MSDLVSNLMSTIKNNEVIGRKECIIYPTSKLCAEILKIMQEEGYIGEFEHIDDGKGGKFRITLMGRINNCGVIRPRFPVKKKEIVEWEKKILPAKDMGIIIISTSRGVMTNKKAKELGIGGRLLAFVY